jgi:hypothetical protein
LNFERSTALSKSLLGKIKGVPPARLRSSPAGWRFGCIRDRLDVTDLVAEPLVRMPPWYGLDGRRDAVVAAVRSFLA